MFGSTELRELARLLGRTGVVRRIPFAGRVQQWAGAVLCLAVCLSALDRAEANASPVYSAEAGPYATVTPVAADATAELLLAAADGSQDALTTSSRWDLDFAPPGMNERVLALAADGNGNLYAGGRFTTAGATAAAYIAVWNGSVWNPLGSGMNGYVNALAFDGVNLYAAGSFSSAGGVHAPGVAKWDGTTWSSLGSGLGGTVNAMVLGADGDLFVGGDFLSAGGVPAYRVARWDGAAWSALGDGMDNQVFALARGPGHLLYAAGNFATADGMAAAYVARWDGSSWSPLGAGTNNAINALTVDALGNVFAGGLFTTAGAVSASRIARWNGSAWSALGAGTNTTVHSLAVAANGSLLVGGAFTTAGSIGAARIARWNGASWSAFGTGMDSYVYAIAPLADGGMFVGGTFTTAGGGLTNYVARWNGASWSGLGGGLNQAVQALADDGNGATYAGGVFTVAGGVAAAYIAKWDGTTWSRLGSGMNNYVNAIAIDDNGYLYAGGAFTTAGGIAAPYVAKWNGSSWSSLGSGVNGEVLSLAVDGNGMLYAGGAFTTAGGVSTPFVAKWNGSSWSGLAGGKNNLVRALAVGANGRLYAAGSFTQVSGTGGSYVSQWDGSSWSAMGSGPNWYVNALVWDGLGTLYAGGEFTLAGVSARYVARWDGAIWRALGAGMDSSVKVLAVDDGGNLYAGGNFLTAGGQPAANVARWDGVNWSALESGTNGMVNALAARGTVDVKVGGSFTTAGAAASRYCAIWHGIAGVRGVAPADGSTVTTNEVPFSWSDVGAAYCRLWIDDDADFSSPVMQPRFLASLRGAPDYGRIYGNTFELPGNYLAPGGSYHWKVRAYVGADSLDMPALSFVYQPQAASGLAWSPLYRLYNPQDTDHFYCTSLGHGQIAESQGYRLERIEGFVVTAPPGDPDLVPVFRFYDGALKTHYYTRRQSRVDSLITANLAYEGITGYVHATPLAGHVPLYHLSGPGGIDNLYTANEDERQHVVASLGFVLLEVLGWVSPSGDSTNVPAHEFAGLVGAGISPGTGNFTNTATTDFSIPSTGLPLTLEHEYHSLGVQLLSARQPLGPGWSHSFNAYVLTVPGMWLVAWPDGGLHRYSQETGSCLDRALGVYDRMEVLPGGRFEITKKNQVNYTFERPAGAAPGSPSLLTAITDRNQNRISCEYETMPPYRLLGVDGTTGHRLEFLYDDPDPGRAGLITGVQLVGGGAIAFAYDDTNGNLTSYTDCDGKVTRYLYDEEYREDHQLVRIELPAGNAIDNEYSERRVRGQTVDGVQVSLDYSPGATTLTTGAGTQVRYDCDPLGRVTALTDVSGGTGTMSIQRADTLNPALPTSVQDRRGNTTWFSYDGRGNVVSVVQPLGVTHTMTYTARNDLESYTDPRSRTTSYGYDTVGNLVSVTDPIGRTTAYVRRPDGLLDAVVDPLMRTLDLEYDSHGNLAGVSDPLSNHVSYAYDDRGRLLRETDGAGYGTTHEYDCAGRRRSTIDAMMGTATFSYDPNGNLGCVVDPRGGATSWTYNGLDLLESVVNPLGQTTEFSYRADGRLVGRARPTGTTVYGYDGSGALASVSSTGALFAHDANGNMTVAADARGSLLFSYDALNRLEAATDYDMNVVNYTYDAASNLRTLAYAPGKVVSYTYYDDNRLHTVTDWFGQTTTYTYFADGMVQGVQYGNGSTASYGYDGAGRLVQLTHRKSGGEVIASYTFDLDRRGLVIGMDRQEPLSAPSLPGSSVAASYDAANRSLASGTTSYSFDGAGNLTGRTGPVPLSLTYDLENRLTSIAGSVDATFTYDALGHRRSATRDGVTTKYVLDVRDGAGRVLMEKDAAGMPVAYYIYGVGLISRISGGDEGAVSYYHHDRAGNIVAISANDGNTLTHRYSYGPFGELLASDEPPGDWNPFRFAGLEGMMAEAHDLYFARARYYDASTGRFLSEDPVWDLNLYSYCGNDPVNFVDPRGMKKDYWAIAKDSVKQAGYNTMYTVTLGNFYGDKVDWGTKAGVALGRDVGASVVPMGEFSTQAVDFTSTTIKVAWGRYTARDGFKTLRKQLLKGVAEMANPAPDAIKFGNTLDFLVSQQMSVPVPAR